MTRRLLPAILCSAAIALAIAGCRRKNRLTGSDFDLRVSPPAATVVKGSTVTLTAVAGSADINPTWTVSGVGSVSASLGRSVDFISDQLGDTQVTATYDGVAATAQIAVVSFVPSSDAAFFNVYTDAGLPVGTGILSDIDVFGGLTTLTELQTGYTPEGIKYQQGTANAAGFSGWDVTLDKGSAGRSKDLSAFASGRMHFSIRLHRLLAFGEEVQVGLDDTNGAPGNDGHVALVANAYMSGQTTDWQDVSVPISAFLPTQVLSSVKVPFAIVLLNTTSPITFDIDAVRWEK